MTIEQIAKIANTTLNDENSKVFTTLKPQIESWLNSDLFLYGGGEQEILKTLSATAKSRANRLLL